MGDRGLVTHSLHLKILTIVQEVHTNGWPSGFASLGFLLSLNIIIDNPIRLDYHLWTDLLLLTWNALTHRNQNYPVSLPGMCSEHGVLGWQWVSGWLLSGGHGVLLTNTHRQGDWPVSISSSPDLPWSIMMLNLKIRSNHWAQFLPDVDDWWRPLRDSCSATSHLHHDVFINILMSHHHIFNILVMFLISDVWKLLVDIFLWNMLF